MANGVVILDRKGYKISFQARVMSDAEGSSAIYTSPWDTEILRDDKLALVWELESGEYFYRPKLNGTIKLVGELASQVMEVMDNDAYVELTLREVYDEPNGPYSQFGFSKELKFRIRKSDCKIVARGKINPGTDGQSFKYYYILEVSPTPMDWYEKIVDNWDKEYDLIKLKAPRSELKYVRRPCLQLYCQDNDYIGNFLGGNYWETPLSDDNGVVPNNRRFTKVACIRSIRIQTDYPSTVATHMDGVYWFDVLDFIPSPSAVDYYVYQNNDISTGKALHIYLWGGQSNQTTAIMLSRNYGTESNPQWIDIATVVKGKSPADGGYDFYQLPGGGVNWTTPGSFEYETATSHIKAVLQSDVYYARWFLPSSIFGRTTYERPGDDLVETSGISDYRYLAYSIPSDVIIKGGTSDGTPDIYGQNDLGEYFHSPGSTYCPLLQSSWNYVGIWLNRESFNSVLEASGRETITIPDGYRVVDALKYMVLATMYDGDVEGHTSEIEFLEPHLTDISPADRSHYTLESWRMTPKSNIVRGKYSLAAQKAPITLRSILDLIKQTRKYYWYRNSEGKIVLTTEEYILNTLPSESGFYMDVGDSVDAMRSTRNYRPLNWGGGESLEYDKDGIPERETFGWMDSSTEPFNGHTILNLGNMVKPDQTEETKVADFTSDVDYMVISPSECSLDGFALVFNFRGTGNYPIGNVSYLGTSYTLGNYLMSFTYLFTSYLNKRRPTKTYKYLYATSVEYTATNLTKTARQDTKIPIPLIWDLGDVTTKSIPIAGDSDTWYGKIDVKFGTGFMTKISINLASRIASVTLALEP